MMKRPPLLPEFSGTGSVRIVASMNFRSQLLALVATAFQAIFTVSALGQTIAYESFAGIPVGSGLAGSGSRATGRTDSGWANGSNPGCLGAPLTAGAGCDN